MLMRRNDFPTLLSTRRNTPSITSWLDEVFEDAFTWSEGTFVPGLNVYETDDKFEVTVELPGMRKEDIDISINDKNILTVSGERRAEHEEGNGRRYHRVESRFGSFSRSMPLPNIVNRDSVEAVYENGVLAISIAKTAEKAGKKIDIA